jgi:uncharacterized protein (TIGR03118 family)
MQHAGLNKWPCSDEKAAYSGVRRLLRIACECMARGGRRLSSDGPRFRYTWARQVTDPLLQNPWGFSFNPATGGGVGSPFWISNQVTNAATLYAVNGSGVSKVNINPPGGFVAIPTRATGPQGPTGQVFNFASPAFVMGNNGPPALLMFANLNGTISTRNPGVGAAAVTQVTTPGAVYTGLALDQQLGLPPLLLAANNAGAGSIDVFGNNFAPVSLGAAHLQPLLRSAQSGWEFEAKHGFHRRQTCWSAILALSTPA